MGHVTQELYSRYGRQIYAYCMQQLRSREEAEDAVQTTFLNAFRGLQGGTVAQCEQAWLYKIAHNVCVARRMSTGRRLRLESPSNFEVLQETVASPGTTGDVELIGLEDALEAMPENQRRAILLREWQGLSYREIGEELGLSQSSVEMLIFRARRALAHALEQPEAPKMQRASRGLSLGSLVAAIKSLFGGGTAVKAIVVAVTATATAVGGAVQHTVVHPPHAAAPAAVTAAAEPSRVSVALNLAARASAGRGAAPASRALPHARIAGAHSAAARIEATPQGEQVAVPEPEQVAPDNVTPVAVETPSESPPVAGGSTPPPPDTNTAAAPSPAPEVAPPPIQRSTPAQQQPVKPSGNEPSAKQTDPSTGGGDKRATDTSVRSDKAKPKDARQTASSPPPSPPAPPAPPVGVSPSPVPAKGNGNDPSNGNDKNNGNGNGNDKATGNGNGNGNDKDKDKGHGNAPFVPTLSSAQAPSPPVSTAAAPVAPPPAAAVAPPAAPVVPPATVVQPAPAPAAPSPALPAPAPSVADDHGNGKGKSKGKDK